MNIIYLQSVAMY